MFGCLVIDVGLSGVIKNGCVSTSHVQQVTNLCTSSSLKCVYDQGVWWLCFNFLNLIALGVY